MEVIWGRSLVTEPTSTPVSLTEVKEHLHVDTTQQDTRLLGYLASATEYAEMFTRRAIMRQTWDFKRDRFPGCSTLLIPMPPLVSITSVSYVDSNGDSQTWASSNYVVDTSQEPGEVRLAYNATWPVVRSQPVAVTVRAVTGWATASKVPARIKQAILMLAGHWYENRESVLTGTISKEIEQGVHDLLWSCRVEGFF